LDGQPLGDPYDHYSAQGVTIDRHDYGDIVLAAGKHTITFTVTGKQNASPRYGFGVDVIELAPR
jgi:hypothetical protein